MKAIRPILLGAYPKELVDALLDAFEEMERAFQTRKWKASELDAGHFVEASRRILSQQLTGSYTPIGKKLPQFSEQALKGYLGHSGHESYRILIPRVLWAMYAIRNKRGVAHTGEVSPNELDATTVLRMAKWVLGEFIRLNSDLSADETEKVLHQLVQREIPDLWMVDGRPRILNTSWLAKDKVLVHLLAHSPQTDDELQSAIEYKNKANFRKILTGLHKNRLIEYGDDNRCHLSPKGEIEAEELVLAET